MNRKFKFRIWEPATKEMVYVDAISIYSEDNLMQWTGLVDKNGKDIYEGDILERTLVSGIISRNDVYWDFGAWQLYRQGVLSELELYEDSYDRMTVIGNIYQNPELLNTNDPTRELPDPI